MPCCIRPSRRCFSPHRSCPPRTPRSPSATPTTCRSPVPPSPSVTIPPSRRSASPTAAAPAASPALRRAATTGRGAQRLRHRAARGRRRHRPRGVLRLHAGAGGARHRVDHRQPDRPRHLRELPARGRARRRRAAAAPRRHPGRDARLRTGRQRPLVRRGQCPPGDPRPRRRPGADPRERRAHRRPVVPVGRSRRHPRPRCRQPHRSGARPGDAALRRQRHRRRHQRPLRRDTARAGRGSHGYLNLDGGSSNGEAGGSGTAVFGRNGWSLRGGGSARRTGDYDTPIGQVPNSQSDMVSLGSSVGYADDKGFVGAAYNFNRTTYGIPYVEVRQHHPQPAAPSRRPARRAPLRRFLHPGPEGGAGLPQLLAHASSRARRSAPSSSTSIGRATWRSITRRSARPASRARSASRERRATTSRSARKRWRRRPRSTRLLRTCMRSGRSAT